jgi:hypothetical protein
LVERRQSDGKPRSHIVAALGTYLDDDRDDPIQRRIFWRGVCGILDTLTLAPDVRQRIESEIAARIPPATDREYDREMELRVRWGQPVECGKDPRVVGMAREACTTTGRVLAAPADRRYFPRLPPHCYRAVAKSGSGK